MEVGGVSGVGAGGGGGVLEASVSHSSLVFYCGGKYGARLLRALGCVGGRNGLGIIAVLRRTQAHKCRQHVVVNSLLKTVQATTLLFIFFLEAEQPSEHCRPKQHRQKVACGNSLFFF